MFKPEETKRGSNFLRTTSRYQMEPMELCGGASAAEEDDRMMTCEMEAVEALATLARCSAVCGGDSGLENRSQKLVKEPTVTCSRRSSQDQAIAILHGNASTMVTSALNTEETVRIVPSKLCGQSNSASKLRQKSTEAEKEVRRLRRVLANRESARLTVRRRQAMHLMLIRKAADLSEENENLKKEKELAVKEHNSLKGRNELLKLQIINVKKAEPREIRDETKSSQAEIATSATISSPVSLYNQPSLVPFVCPFVPSSNVIHLQHAYHSDIMSSSQFSTQQRDISSSGITGPGNPLFVLPVPWLLPFPSYSTMVHSYSDTNKRQNETPSTHQCSMSSSSDTPFLEDNHELSSNLNMWMEASNCKRSMSVGSAIGAGFTYPVDSGDQYTGDHPKVTLVVPEKLSSVRPVESIRPTRNSEEDNIYNTNAISATKHMSKTLPKNPEPIISRHKKSENVFAATKARRRRKELIKLKNIQCHHVRSHSANC